MKTLCLRTMTSVSSPASHDPVNGVSSRAPGLDGEMSRSEQFHSNQAYSTPSDWEVHIKPAVTCLIR